MLWLLALSVHGIHGQPITNPGPSASQPAVIPPALMDRLSAIPSGGRLAVIPIEGMLGERHRLLLQKRLEQAEKDGASVVLLVLDTPGGELHATLRMSTRLKQSPIPVIAYVKDQAYSGGAVLAVSCRAIIVSRGSAIGDCAPIVPGQTLGETERAKALAPLLENLRDSATANGYDYPMLHAMTELGVPIAPTATGFSHDGKTLLTLSGQRAMDAGLAQAITDQPSQVIQWLGAAQVQHYEIHPMDNVAYWLTRPWIRGLLLLVALLGIGLELQAPGLSLPGLVGGLALLSLLAGPMIVGLAAWWHLMLFLFGVLLLVAELFLFPGTMAMGVAGIAAMLTSLVLAVSPGASGFGSAGGDSYLWPLAWLLAGGGLALALLWLLGTQWSQLPLVGRMILRESVTPGPARPDPVLQAPEGIRVGDIGRSLTELRPSGRAVFGDLRPIDVVTLGNWIASGQRIKVVELRGHDVLVDLAGDE